MGAPAAAPASWSFTGDAAVKELARQRAIQDKNRRPTIWLKDGEKKNMRFMHPGPIACLYRYRVKVNGNWVSFTAPPEGSVDLFASELRLQSAFCAIYEVCDLDGYLDKTTRKKIQFKRRFFEASGKTFTVLEMTREKMGPLCDYDMEVCRAGADISTNYMFFPSQKSPMSAQVKAGPSLKPEFAKYYSPPTAEEQKLIVRGLAPVSED